MEEFFLEVMFSVWSVPRLYSKEEWEKLVMRQSPANKGMNMEAQEYALL
jgi:hypothetical protein